MKVTTPCLILFCLLICTKSSAQHDYIPIKEDSALWITVIEDWHEEKPPPTTHSFTYSVGRTLGVDTIVNGNKYFCYFGEYGNFDLPLTVGKPAAKFGHWLRQDNISKKVWYVRTQSEPYTEEVLYDFSYKKGDTINDLNYRYFSPDKLYPYKAWIDDIDSIYLADGAWHYRWWIKSNYGIANSAFAIMIEGLGYTTNFIDDPLLEYHPLVGITKDVVCYRERMQWIYHIQNPWQSSCDTLLSRNILEPDRIRDVSDIEQPILYPNPVSAQADIHFNARAGDPNEYYNIIAINKIGTKVLSTTVKPGTSIPLQTLGLQSGIYYFRIADKRGITIATKTISIL